MKTTDVNVIPPSKMNLQNLDYTIKWMYYSGLWEVPDEPRTYSFYIRFYFPRLILFRMLYGFLIQCYNVYLVYGDSGRMGEYALLGLAHVIVFVKLGTMFSNRHSIRAIFDRLEELSDSSTIVDDHHRDIIDGNNRYCDRLTKSVLIYCISNYVIFNAVGVIKAVPTKELHFRLWYPYDAKSSPMYELTMTWHVVAYFFDISFVPLCDVLFIVLTTSIVAHFKALVHKVNTIRQHTEKRLDNMDKLKKATRTVSNSTDILRERRIAVSNNSDTTFCNQLNVPNADDLQVDFSCEPECNIIILDEEHEAQEVRLATNNLTNAQEDVIAKERKNESNENNVEKSIETSAETLKETVEPDPNKVNEKHQLRNEMDTSLKGLVKEHQLLIRLTTELQDAFQIILTFQVLLIAFCSPAGLYIDAFGKGIDIQASQVLGIMVFGVMEMLIFSFFAGQVTTWSFDVREAAYSCDWFDASEEFKHSLRIIMSRSQNPLYIKAGGIPLSLVTFRTVCRLTYYSHTMITKIISGEKINEIRESQ